MSSDYLSDAVDIAAQMLEHGGEVFRAEEVIRRICKAESKGCNVFALPSVIIAQSDDKIEVRRIKLKGENLTRLCELNSQARRLSREYSSDNSLKTLPYAFTPISTFLATASFCIFFGGSITDSIFSGLIGLIIAYGRYNSLKLPEFSVNLISSFIAGFLSVIPEYFSLHTHFDKIIIGAIMLLVPGLTIANAARDMMKSDILAGLLELAGAIISALSIAFGVAGALLISGKL